MKLNNKGFAISTIMYMILIMGVLLITLTLTLLSSRKLILDKSRQETANNIYNAFSISYREALEILKGEAITYGIENDIEKDSIKIGNLNSSIDKEILDGYKLSEKYLTLLSNDSTYDVYLGRSKTITDISKPTNKLLDIIDYKISGNSVQDGIPTLDTPIEIKSVGDKSKNLFDKDNLSAYGYIGDTFSVDEAQSAKIYQTDGDYGISIQNIFKENTQYSIKFREKYVGSKGYVRVDFIYTDGTTINAVNEYSASTWTTRTATSEAGKTLEKIRFSNAGNGSSYAYYVDLDSLQLEEGTKVDRYIPYDKYSIPITVSGKNLLNPNSILSYVPFDAYLGTDLTNLDTPYSLSVKLKENKQVPEGVYFGLVYKDSEDATRASAVWMISDGVQQYTFTSSDKANTNHKIGLAVYPGTQQNWDKIMDAFEISLYLGKYTEDTMPKYEPYVDVKTTNIYLDEPLRKVEDSSDSIEFGNSKVVRNIGQIIYDGSDDEEWTVGSEYNGYTITNTLFEDGVMPMSNIAPGILSNSTSILSIRKNYNAIRMQNFNTFADTVEEFRNLLSTTPAKIICKLATPDDTETNELPRIQTSINSTMISVDTKIQPSSLEFTIVEKIKQI